MQWLSKSFCGSSATTPTPPNCCIPLRPRNFHARDHGLATELVMGVLRWQSLLDQRLAAASSQKIERLDDEVLAALRLGVYQLQFLSRVPARAAIFESVELVKAARKRSAASFVNVVLRKIGTTSGKISSQKSRPRPTRSRWLGTPLIPLGWWRAGWGAMDLNRRARSAHMIRRCPTRPFTFMAIDLRRSSARQSN